MSRAISIRRDRTVPVDAKLFRQIGLTLLQDLLALEDFELGVSLVRAEEMARVNWTFLQHEGSTDVITFDHTEPGTRNPEQPVLNGELFICYDDAVSQAREFHTSWQSEIARYLVHGVLHLRGFDDHRAEDRRKMKREENRLLRELTQRFPISKLARHRESS